jgi:vacuolar-type H+-ATPase subunit I/STV1
MTDKQIIDGEQCEYLRDTGLCRLTYCFTEKSYDCSMCKDNPNCHYKNWQRKEQECEELKDEILHLRKEGNKSCAYCADLIAKEQEFDQLKAENEVLEKVNKSNQEKIKKLNEQLEEEFIKHQYGQEALFFEMEDYKQTLQEIKEIAERDKEFCIKCNGDKEIDCVDCTDGGRALLAKQILQKISECEVE